MAWFTKLLQRILSAVAAVAAVAAVMHCRAML
jgi:hypothetical protein